MEKNMAITAKRIYDVPGRTDGIRILVDRLWPRGMKKETARVDEWLREIAPSTELRNWFGHKPERWLEFQKRYRRELQQHPRAELAEHLRSLARRKKVTLLYGARDTEHNQAVALSKYLNKQGS